MLKNRWVWWRMLVIPVLQRWADPTGELQESDRERAKVNLWLLHHTQTHIHTCTKGKEKQDFSQTPITLCHQRADARWLKTSQEVDDVCLGKTPKAPLGFW